MIRRRNDDGVIAIIVALSISTFLLGFAALAVDLGSAYLRKAELQSIADRLAVAGAAGLPNIGTPQGALDRMRVQLVQICRDSPTPGLCPADGSAPNLDWATDLDPSNGQVTFLSDPDGDGQYSLADQVSATATADQGTATALQVMLPPSTVQFGLASAVGFSSATIHKSATARVGTPLGRGILPFPLVNQDLSAAQNGQFCVNVAGGTPAVVPGTVGPIKLDQVTPYPGGVPNSTQGLTMEITLQDPNGQNPEQTTVTNPVLSYLDDAEGSQPYPIPLTPEAGKVSYYTFPLPPADPGILASIWVTGTYQGQPFVTGEQTTPGNPGEAGDIVHYTPGNAPSPDGLCNQAAAFREPLLLDRTPAIGDPLPLNIQTGPDIKLYEDGDGLGALGTIGRNLHCGTEFFIPATTCLTSQPGGPSFQMDVEAGLLQSAGGLPGRLIGDCGTSTTDSSSHGVNDASLFDPASGLLAPGVDGGTLKTDLTTAQPAPAGSQGLITSAALRCPRLAVLPVIDHVPGLGHVGTARITGFRYVWIDQDGTMTRGVNGTGGTTITSFRGYIIPGGYLPSLVAGSPVVGPYLGGDMPREALLIHDLNTPTP